MDHIVRGYVSWCLHCDPGTKYMSQQWKHLLSSQLKKIRAISSAGKMTLILFFDHHGPLQIDWLPKSIIVNADLYGGTLEHNKSPSILSCGIILV